jgi:hypothetical protein
MRPKQYLSCCASLLCITDSVCVVLIWPQHPVAIIAAVHASQTIPQLLLCSSVCRHADYSLVLKRLVLRGMTMSPLSGEGGLPQLLPLGMFTAVPRNLSLYDVHFVVSPSQLAEYLMFFSHQLRTGNDATSGLSLQTVSNILPAQRYAKETRQPMLESKHGMQRPPASEALCVISVNGWHELFEPHSYRCNIVGQLLLHMRRGGAAPELLDRPFQGPFCCIGHEWPRAPVHGGPGLLLCLQGCLSLTVLAITSEFV